MKDLHSPPADSWEKLEAYLRKVDIAVAAVPGLLDTVAKLEARLERIEALMGKPEAPSGDDEAL